MVEKKKKVFKTMAEAGFVPTLPQTLKELGGMTRNALAVEAKVRPASINDIYSGKTRSVNFETMADILDALNRSAFEQGVSKQHTVEDIFKYDARTKKSAE